MAGCFGSTGRPCASSTSAALNAFLAEAGFGVEAQYGDWQRGAIGDASREIITVARRD